MRCEQEIITEEERTKCRRVMRAFTDLYESTDVIVVEAGKYGFVKLQYFNQDNGFDDTVSILDSQTMFEDLWEEWYDWYLLESTKNTPMEDMSYEKMYQWLPDNKKKELEDKRVYFARKAGIRIA